MSIQKNICCDIHGVCFRSMRLERQKKCFLKGTKYTFVSLQNVILSSCLTFDDGVCYRTSDNTFIPISNSEKPVAGNKCYVQTKDIIIHPLTEYLSYDINQCGATSCHTCNIFINDQSFKSNLTGKEYKTISYDRLSRGSTNVIYEYIAFIVVLLMQVKLEGHENLEWS